MQAGRLKDAGKIGVKIGKVINTRKVGKHFITDIADGRLEFQRDQEKIDAEAALDGIYVIRTSAAEEKLGAAETVEAYKDLGNLERDFWSMKAEDIDLRPIYHYLENRVRGHVLICMLTAKDTAKITPGKLPVRGYHELVAHLATLTRNTVSLAGKRLEKLTMPTPGQRLVFDLLGKPIPLSLDGT